MSKQQEISSGVCRICGETLQQVKCPCCGGRGFVKNLLIEAECSGCEGSGQVMCCPGELQHVTEPNHALLPALKMEDTSLPPLRRMRPEKQVDPLAHSLPKWGARDKEG